jgi:predicted RNA-binding Zn-ribbon protein involved in translation (DUF1610 family)
MKCKLALVVLALLVVGLASTALAMQPVACTKCFHSEDTVTWYLCPDCLQWFTVEPCQSGNGLLPPARWDCPDCGHKQVWPQYACCAYDLCTGGMFWP